MISLIHPSRGRPEKSFDRMCFWNKHYSGLQKDLETIVSIDNDDPLYYEYKKYHNGNVISNDNKSAVDAINNAAKVAKGDIFIVVSDDTASFPGWNIELYESIKGHGIDWILKTQDGIQPYIITMPVMDRAYYNRTGHIYDPDFKHMFCDTWLTVQADISGRKITSQLKFPHLNDSIKDEVRVRSDATWKEGERMFIDKVRSLPHEDLKKIQDASMRNWIRNKTGIRI